MHRISSRFSRSCARLVREDDGFGLIEVMVSAIIIVALALATLNLLDGAQRTSSNNRSRDVAAQIAQSEQDKLRQMPITQLAGGYDQSTSQTSGAIPYKVHTTADWIQDSGGPVTCSTSGAVSYLQTTTSVTWPGMGKIKPVSATANIAPGVAALGAKKGALTVLLSHADGTGTSGVTVTVQGMSAVTDENGCAVIGNLDVGPQTLSYNDAAYVDKDSIQAVSRTVNIGAGTIAQATGYYDGPGILDLTVTKDPAAVQGSVWNESWNEKYTLDHDQRTTPTTFFADYDSSDGITTKGLFPFASSYRAYAGTCAGNNPANALYGGTNQGVQLDPGQRKTLAVALPTAKIRVDASNVATAANRGDRTIVVVEPETGVAAMAGCTAAGTSFSDSSSYGTGTKDFVFQLPYGVYRTCAFYRHGTLPTSKWELIRSTTTLPSISSPNPIVATPAASGNYKANLTSTLKPSDVVGTLTGPPFDPVGSC